MTRPLLLLGLAGASLVALALLAQDATEAPAGFNTPTLSINPGSQSISNGATEPPGDHCCPKRLRYTMDRWAERTG